MQNIILFDFDEDYPPVDNPLEALICSLVETKEFTCTLYTANLETLHFAEKYDIQCHYIQNPFSKRISTFFTIVKALRKSKAILHAFGTKTVEAILPLHYRFGKGKLITTLTSPLQITSLPKLQKLYTRVAFITAPTRHAINTMSQILLFPQNKTTVIPFGITKNYYAPIVQPNNTRIIFTVVAPLEVSSSLFEILDSLSILYKANILLDWEIRFVGKGPAFHSLIEHAQQLGIVDRIALLGDYPLPDILGKSSVLILPVFFWNIAQVIYAGILSDIPVIHTKDPNVLDILDFQYTESSSFTHSDSLEIRSAIKSIIDTQSRLNAPVYSIDQTIDTFHAVYRKIINSQN